MSDWSSEVCPSDLKAGDCLDGRTKALRGRTLTEVMPEADELLAEARRRPRKLAERQLAIPDASGAERVLLVRISAEIDDGAVIGFVVTFAEITQLLAAPRKAAWSDIAPPIPPQNQNPPTPIPLATDPPQPHHI